MATQPNQSDSFRLDLLFRSETLPILRKFLEMSPDLKSLVDQRGLQIKQQPRCVSLGRPRLRWLKASLTKSLGRTLPQLRLSDGPCKLRVEMS
jgi:hypothetical protein